MAKNSPRPPPSPKAGRPPPAAVSTSRAVKRRQKTAHTAVRKHTMILQSPQGASERE
jgi:hypothetical protein